MTLIGEKDENYPIRPDHINTGKHFWDAFGRMEPEISASWVVMLCKELKSWKPFSFEELMAFYRGKGMKDDFSFNGLLEKGFIVLMEDQKYHITHEFVSRCFLSSPNSSVLQHS